MYLITRFHTLIAELYKLASPILVTNRTEAIKSRILIFRHEIFEISKRNRITTYVCHFLCRIKLDYKKILVTCLTFYYITAPLLAKFLTS